MTWGEFKKLLEAAGVTDADEILDMDVTDPDTAQVRRFQYAGQKTFFFTVE
jgi:hypothetical protein